MNKISLSRINQINILLSTIKKYKQEYHQEPSNDKLAELLLISKKEIIEIKKLIKELEKNDSSLEERKPFLIENLSKEEYEQIVKLIYQNKHLLNEREKEILLLSFGLIDEKKWSLKEISIKFNITEKRARQILAKGIRIVRHPERREKLKKIMGNEQANDK